jgi:cyclase
VVLVLIAAGNTLYMVYLQPFLSKMKQTEVSQLSQNLTIITGGGGNICIITSDSLVVVVDSKMDEASEMLYQRVTDLAAGRKIVVINTHWHLDHVGGNKSYTDATIIAGGNYSLDEWGKKQVRKAFLRFGWRTR